MMMKKLLTAGVAAAILGAASFGASAPAQARSNGGAIAAGVVGGLALGAIAGSAAAGAGPAYGGYPAYGPPPEPAYGGCYMSRQETYDPYGNFAGYRRVRVCE